MSPHTVRSMSTSAFNVLTLVLAIGAVCSQGQENANHTTTIPPGISATNIVQTTPKSPINSHDTKELDNVSKKLKKVEKFIKAILSDCKMSTSIKNNRYPVTGSANRYRHSKEAAASKRKAALKKLQDKVAERPSAAVAVSAGMHGASVAVSSSRKKPFKSLVSAKKTLRRSYVTGKPKILYDTTKKAKLKRKTTKKIQKRRRRKQDKNNVGPVQMKYDKRGETAVSVSAGRASSSASAARRMSYLRS